MFKPEEATISQIQDAVAAKDISYKELTLLYLERIAAVDACEGGLNSVLEVNPDALTIARFMDDERAKGVSRGPLHGIPVLIKDNINTGDRMNTSAGSLALADNFATMDAVIVRNLREKGAIILGKTNMTEFANWMTRGMPNGYSSRGGQVLNPYNRDADPSGSSTGSAVAVSANLCAVSVGTETHGSIIAPAFANGIVGIKPTAGLLSGHGIIPISVTLDTAGPMARTVRDAAILLSGLKGIYDSSYDMYNAFSHSSTFPQALKEYEKDLERSSLRGLRIGIYGLKNENDNEFNSAFEPVLAAIANAGAEIIKDLPQVTPEPPWNYMGNTIAKHEFKRSLNSYFRAPGNATFSGSLKSIIEFNEKNSETCLKYGQTILRECQYESGGNLTEPVYIEALRRRETAINHMEKLFSENKLDIMISAGEHSGIAPLTGIPSGTLPFGTRKNKVPMGMYFMARRLDEANLIRAMYATEQLIGKRQAPNI